MAGRKTKLTPTLQDDIVKRIRAGNYIKVSCRAVGISTSTYFDWLKKGEKGTPPYSEFLYSIKKAEAEAQVNFVAVIARAAPESWQAAAWWLERRFPDLWGRREKIDLQGEIKTVREADKIEEKFKNLSPKELSEYASKLAQKMLYGGTLDEKRKKKEDK